MGAVGVDFQYHKAVNSITLETTRTGTGDCGVEFSPALSPRTRVVSVEMNGRPLPFKIQPNGEDQHLTLRFTVSGGPKTVVIRVKNDFGLTLANALPPLGDTSRSLRVISNLWNPAHSQLTLEVSGLPGMDYELGVWNAAEVSSVEGAVLTPRGTIQIKMPAGKNGEYLHRSVVIHFRKS